MRHWLLTLFAACLPLALSQSVPESHFAPGTGADAIDPRYEATLRELVATPSGRAFLEALQLIDREYLYTTDRDELLRGATAGLIAALDDPFSRYLAPEVVAARRAGEAPEGEVHKAMLGDVGYVRIRDFDGDAVGARVASAIESHLASGALGLVLDLRGNDGGSILQGLQVLDRFLADGVLGFRRVRGVSVPIAYANPRSVTKPLVVLVDGTTASTAEIVAGALQAYGRAKIVGTVTAGKGIGQSAIELSDGSEIQLVSFEWLLPGFRSIDGTGLRPDVEVAPTDRRVDDDDEPREVHSIHDAVVDPALRAALELLRAVVGDELQAPLTAPAPAPQVGPNIVPLPEGPDAPPAEDEPADPNEQAPPLGGPTPPSGSDTPRSAPGAAGSGAEPQPGAPLELEPLAPALPTDRSQPLQEAPAVGGAPFEDDVPAAGEALEPDETQPADGISSVEEPSLVDEASPVDQVPGADDAAPVDGEPAGDEAPPGNDATPVDEGPIDDGPVDEGAVDEGAAHSRELPPAEPTVTGPPGPSRAGPESNPSAREQPEPDCGRALHSAATAQTRP